MAYPQNHQPAAALFGLDTVSDSALPKCHAVACFGREGYRRRHNTKLLIVTSEHTTYIMSSCAPHTACFGPCKVDTGTMEEATSTLIAINPLPYLYWSLIDLNNPRWIGFDVPVLVRGISLSTTGLYPAFWHSDIVYLSLDLARPRGQRCSSTRQQWAVTTTAVISVNH
jgi:hypothetical protein